MGRSHNTLGGSGEKKTDENAGKESVKLTVFVLSLPLQFTANGSLATNCEFFAISNTVQATDK